MQWITHVLSAVPCCAVLSAVQCSELTVLSAVQYLVLCFVLCRDALSDVQCSHVQCRDVPCVVLCSDVLCAVQC